MSSSSAPHGSPSTPSVSFDTSPGHQEVTAIDGKRTLPQLERTAKVRRMSSESSDISAAIQAAQHTIPSLPQPASPPLVAHVQEMPTLEQALDTLKKQRLNNYEQTIYIPPLAKPSLQASDDTLLPLMDKVQDFLGGDGQVMLILGDSGAGKSTFNRHLEHALWKSYQSGGRIPLFINLPSLKQPEYELIAEQLKARRFSKAQTAELEQHRQFTLICDGYDESQLTSNLHSTNLLNRHGERDVKMIITCRTQYLGPDYRDRFVPKAVDQYHRAANDLYQEAVIAPFSKEQIEDYVERYVPLEARTWVKDDYMDNLTTIPNLLDLVKNPFLLTLALESLPTVVRDKCDPSKLRVTRLQLYDIFVEHWLGVNKRRLQDQKLNGENQKALEELLEDGFEQNGIEFQMNLAAAIFKKQEGRPVVDYTHKRDKNSWKAVFFNTEPGTALLRGASLLSRAGTQYRFVHRSVLEYFYSCSICAPAEFGPQGHFDSTDALQSIADHPLSQRSLVVEPSIVQFLAERVLLIPEFKQHLHAIIKLSKTDPQASRAAANAITILVRARIHLNGKDLRGIRVPGADLSGGQFDSVQLQGADLTGVNLTKVWIRQANLSDARMEGVHFGELPYLAEDGEVNCCVYSSDGHALAVGLNNGDITIYDTSNWSRIHQLRGHQQAVTSLAYSPTDNQLLSGSSDSTVRLWNCKTGLSDFVLKAHSSKVVAVAFSLSGEQFASAGQNSSPKLWSAKTGTLVCDLAASFYDISSIEYSPNGEQIAMGCWDGTVRLFDAHTGLSGLVLKARGAGISCIAYSPDGLRIVSGHGDGRLRLWGTATGEPELDWRGHGVRISSVSFSHNGQWIASTSGNGTVKLWDAQAGALVSSFTGHCGDVNCVVFSPDSSQLASGSVDETVRLWEVSSAGTGVVFHGFSSVSSVAYSPDGQSLACGFQGGIVRQYNAVTGELGFVIQCGVLMAESLAYSSDGLQIATAGRGSNVRIWSAETGAPVQVLRHRSNYVNTVTFSANGRWIATGGDYKT
ncbi:WD_REPEATS_REGION domain-containing protein, partial [Mortierella sp. GBA35]